MRLKNLGGILEMVVGCGEEWLFRNPHDTISSLAVHESSNKPFHKNAVVYRVHPTYCKMNTQ